MQSTLKGVSVNPINGSFPDTADIFFAPQNVRLYLFAVEALIDDQYGIVESKDERAKQLDGASWLES